MKINKLKILFISLYCLVFSLSSGMSYGMEDLRGETINHRISDVNKDLNKYDEVSKILENIVTIKIKPDHQLNPSHFTTIKDKFNNLTSLDISSNILSQDHLIEISKITSICHLDISNCKDITDNKAIKSKDLDCFISLTSLIDITHKGIKINESNKKKIKTNNTKLNFITN